MSPKFQNQNHTGNINTQISEYMRLVSAGSKTLVYGV